MPQQTMRQTHRHTNEQTIKQEHLIAFDLRGDRDNINRKVDRAY